jgi:uncharacterized protein (TIGR03435 family)
MASALAAGSLSAQKTTVAFEVAAITVREPLDLARVRAGQQSLPEDQRRQDRVEILGFSLGALLGKAFTVRPDQISGPKGLALDPVSQLTSGEATFDIRATLPPGATLDQVPEMLQALLVERFKLRFHRERRNQSSIALMLRNDGPKLLKAEPAGATGAVVPGTRPSVQVSGSVVHIVQPSMTMEGLTGLLTTFMKRPVINRTGLAGAYQLVLDFSVTEAAALSPLPAGAPQNDLAGGAGDPGGGASIGTSLARLGLRLEDVTSAADVVVIDHIEKLPTPN